MKKKVILLLVFVFTAFFNGSSISANQPENINFDQDNLKIEMVSQNVLNELYKEHLALRNEKAELTDEQKDYLLAYGVDPKRIDELTNGDVADVLKNAEILKLQFIEKYIDKEKLYQDALESKSIIIDKLKNMGLNEKEIESFFEYGLNISDYDDHAKSKIQHDLKMNDKIHLRSTSCHVFRGPTVVNLLNEDNVHFHADVYPRYGGPNGSTPLPLNPDPGTAAYNEKVAVLTSNLNATVKYAKVLYKTSSTSGISYNYNLYGEETGSIYHKGIDTIRGANNNIYSISSGKVIARSLGSPGSSLSTIFVYNPTYGITLIYMHMTVDSSITLNKEVYKDTLLGTESNRGQGIGTHTHIQIELGQRTTATPGASQDMYPTMGPYAYFNIFC